MGTRKGQKHYSRDFKVKLVSEHYQNGETLSTLVKLHGVSMARLCVWCKEYREGGYAGIGSKTKGRPRKAPDLEQNPQQRIKQLEMEVDLLKAFLYEVERWNVKR